MTLSTGGKLPTPPNNRRTDVMRVTEKAEAKMIAIVRVRISAGMVLLYTFTCSCPFSRFHIMSRRMAKLVVLIPPPVEPGDAPMNISIIIIKSVTGLSILKLIPAPPGRIVSGSRPLNRVNGSG
jgi:hypothetical protein